MPLSDLVGHEKVRYRMGLGECDIFGRKIHIVSGNDERSESKLRGAEFAGALVDEISVLPETFFKMLLSRLSIRDAKLFGTTNPDHPGHWLKRDIIDRSADINCKVFSFQLDDNPSLSEEYKRDLKKEFSGLWFSRFILGEWTASEGCVYSFFDDNVHVIDMPVSEPTTFIGSIDYGISNPCVFLLAGYNPSASPQMWIEKEYCFDSSKEMYQKSDYELCQDFIKFIDGIYCERIYIDPSATSFKVEFRRQGFSNVIDAVNDVLPGIQFVSQMFMNGTLKICTNCTGLIKEIYGYSWDPRASQNGIDKPLKRNDHYCDALRYLCYSYLGTRGVSTMTEEDALRMENAWYRPMSRYS
jgi:PBSX family phage terminase large subunit